MSRPEDQSEYRVRFDWGLAGATAVTGTVAVVVDVLSFTTTVTVAADRGITVLPFRWRDDSAARYADEQAATLAVGRSEAGADGVSLSPASIRRATGIDRLVLPSPNGSTIAQQLRDEGATVVAAALRNRAAAARWVAGRLVSDPATSVVVIAAGEQWPDGSARPAVEDLWGAGGVLAALADRELGPLSPEAKTAEAAYRGVVDELPRLLWECAGGRELTQYGFGEDVAIAAELDRTDVVPVLRDAGFAVQAVQ